MEPNSEEEQILNKLTFDLNDLLNKLDFDCLSLKNSESVKEGSPVNIYFDSQSKVSTSINNHVLDQNNI